MKAFISTIFCLLLYLFSWGETINPYEYNIYRNDIPVTPYEYKKTTQPTNNSLTCLPISSEFKTYHDQSGQKDFRGLTKNKKRKRKYVRHSPSRKHSSQQNKSWNQKQFDRELTEKVIYLVVDIACEIIKIYCTK